MGEVIGKGASPNIFVGIEKFCIVGFGLPVPIVNIVVIVPDV